MIGRVVDDIDYIAVGKLKLAIKKREYKQKGG
jgi:hypothetical protein